MTTDSTRSTLEALARPLVRRAVAGGSAFVGGALLFVLCAGAWLVRLGVVQSLWWVPAAWLLAAGVAAVATVLVLERNRSAGAPALARRLEAEGAWRLGALTGMLAPTAAGLSADLYEAADRARASDLAARGPEQLAPLAARLRRGNTLGGILLLIGALGLLGAGPGRAPVRMLWHPIDAFGLALGAVRLEASALTVERGEGVALTIRAPGRRKAVLWQRATGETWRSTEVTLDSAGSSRVTTGPLSADLFVRATSDRRSSDTLRVAVRAAPFLGAVAVTAHYPGYLGIEDEPLALGPEVIMLPEGTWLAVTGEATAPISTGRWVGPAGSVALAVEHGRFSGRIVPAASGTYRLSLVTETGTPLGGDDTALLLRIVPDSAPQVRIPVPGEDTLAPLGLTVPLVLDARDDHGVSALIVVSWRISGLGVADAERRDPVRIPAGAPERLLAPFTLDLEGRALLPGDTVRYYALATDNAPHPRTGRSREYILRLPTRAEMRAAERTATESVGQQLDSLAAASRRLQRQTEDLSHETPRAAGQPGESSMSFDDAKRAEAVARQQEELVRQAEETRQAIAELQKAVAEAGVQDPEFQRRMQEIVEQLNRALTPEMRQQLESLRQALSMLDAARTQRALQDLAEAQAQLKEALERSQKLFERAAMEGQMANLADEARDLAAAQARWNDEVMRADSAKAAREEAGLAGRADSLAAALHDAAQDLGNMQPPRPSERLDAMAEDAASAATSMKQAAASARQGKPHVARPLGKQAEEQLQSMGAELDQQREAMQAEWKQEVVAAMDRMLAETSRLADRQLAITEQLRAGEPPATFRAQQAALEGGVEKLSEQYREASGEHALVPPQIGQSLESARRSMAQARDALSSATPGQREATGRAGEAVDALNAASYQMVRARGDVAGAGSGSGLAEAMARMTQMAQQQGALSQQGGQLLPMVGGGGMQDQIRQLSAQQRALAERLERLLAETQSGGTAELAEEARDLARQLEAGRLDRSTVERQERLYRRMLDAGRTLQGEEQDEQKERQSTTGTDDNVRLPPALRAQLEDGARQFRLPTWDQLQELSPEVRRLVLDYFRRLADSPAR